MTVQTSRGPTCCVWSSKQVVQRVDCASPVSLPHREYLFQMFHDDESIATARQQWYRTTMQLCCAVKPPAMVDVHGVCS